MEPLLEGLLRSSGGSEANFLEVCFGRLPSGNFHTKTTSKKSGPPSGNVRLNPPELPRSPSRSFSSHEAGWKTVLENASQPQPHRYRKKKSPPRIWTSLWAPLPVIQCSWPYSASPKPHPSKPHPCNMRQAKTEVALQFLECCAAEVALQHSLFCSADVILTKAALQQTKNCTATVKKAALHESGAFLPLSSSHV